VDCRCWRPEFYHPVSSLSNDMDINRGVDDVREHLHNSCALSRSKYSKHSTSRVCLAKGGPNIAPLDTSTSFVIYVEIKINDMSMDTLTNGNAEQNVISSTLHPFDFTGALQSHMFVR
jgi:hypothetical protein